MSQISFEEKYFIARTNTHCTKWDGLEEKFGDRDLIAMWVADMDFRSPPAVINALQQRVAQGVFGYSIIPDEYFTSFINWERTHHGYHIQKEWINYTPGVVTGLYWLVNIFSQPGDAIIVNTPVYYPFLHVVTDCQRTLITSDLINQQGYYRFDYDDFRRKIIDHKVKIYILCSPHNPVGRVWNHDELEQILTICQQHGVLVISDEIHHDLILEGKHLPSARVAGGKFSEQMITFTSASKTFNLAGLKNAFAVIESAVLQEKFSHYANNIAHITNGCLLSYYAVAAAYQYGEPWLRDVLGVFKENYLCLKNAFRDALPLITISPLQGTYLAWIDMRAYCDNQQLPALIQQKCRLAVDYGEWFGEAGKGFIRINLATSRKIIETAAQNIINAIGEN